MLTGYFGSLINAILGLVTLIPIISKGFESVRSIREVLEAPDLEQNEGKLAVQAVRGKFKFETVGFQYPDTNVDAVRGCSLYASAGENIALSGHSGAGKSTVLNLVIFPPSATRTGSPCSKMAISWRSARTPNCSNRMESTPACKCSKLR